MPRKTYGDLIREAREARGKDQAWLATKVDRSLSTVRRWEGNEDPPRMEQVNLLVQNLPLSTEMLLEAMGAALTPKGAERLPRQLVELLLRLDVEEQQGLINLLKSKG